MNITHRQHRSTKPSRKKLSRTKKILLWSSGSILALFLIASATLALSPSVAANFADSVLRPIIGSEATVQLESFFFSVSDHAKQVSYAFGAKPSGDIFTGTSTAGQPNPGETKTIPVTKVGEMHTLNSTSINFHPGTYPKLAGEGVWSPLELASTNGKADAIRTFVLPDASRAYAVTSLVQLNTFDLRLKAVAGVQQPGGPIGLKGPGIIPSSDQKSGTVVAAFNGGFQYKDGKYGMTVSGKNYVPLQNNLGTLIGQKDGTLVIKNYLGDTRDVANASFVRQNGLLIVENGNVTASTANGGMGLWGLTVTNSMYTWRSGIGITKNGNLIYAVGPSLNVDTLAAALKAGGAINAMQLDINPYWVRFVAFQSTGNGNYTYSSLLKDMQNGGYSYLHGYDKDFFYLTTAP